MTDNRQPTTDKGFTLIEILLGIAIAGLCVTIVTLSFNKIQSSQALEKSVLIVLSTLDEARSLTLAAKSNTRYGVNFQDDQLVLFQGTTYATSTPSNIFTPLNPLVGVRNVNLTASSTSVVFNRLSGATNQSGSLEIYLRGEPESFKRITINATGIAELE